MKKQFTELNIVRTLVPARRVYLTIFFLAGIFLGDCLINQTLAQTVGAALEANGAGKKEFDLWEAGCLQRLQTLCLDRKTPADGLSATRGRQNKARIDQIEAQALVGKRDPIQVDGEYPALLVEAGRHRLDRAMLIAYTASPAETFALLEEAHAYFSRARPYGALSFLNKGRAVSALEIKLSLALIRALQGEQGQAARLAGSFESLRAERGCTSLRFDFIKGYLLKEIGRPATARQVLKHCLVESFAAGDYEQAAHCIEAIYWLADCTYSWHECYGFLLDGLAELKGKEPTLANAAYQSGLAQFYLKLAAHPTWAKTIMAEHRAMAVELQNRNFAAEGMKLSVESILLAMEKQGPGRLVYSSTLRNYINYLSERDRLRALPWLKLRMLAAAQNGAAGCADDKWALANCRADLIVFSGLKNRTVDSAAIGRRLIGDIEQCPSSEIIWPVAKLPEVLQTFESCGIEKGRREKLLGQVERSLATVRRFYGETMPFMLELDFLGRLQADKAKAVAMLGRAWNLACQSKTLSMEVRRDILFDFICALREAGQTAKAESLMPMYRGLAACL